MNKLVFVTLMTVVACGGGDPVDDTVADLCTRLDDCNYLEGISVQECIDNRTTCVGTLNESQREDWVVLMEDCLQLQSCPVYGECWLDVPWC